MTDHTSTPRTEQYVRKSRDHTGVLVVEIVPAEVARELERELAEEKAEHRATLTLAAQEREAHEQAIANEQSRAEGLQAKLDALMFEYCPDEMTPEQIEEWGRHQRPVSPERQAELEAALGLAPK